MGIMELPTTEEGKSMQWYAVHVIEYTECLDGDQESYDVFENILLVHALTYEAAELKAREKSMRNPEDQDRTQTWNDRPARQVFGGVRKIILCEDSPERPGDGTEVSYSIFTVESKEDLRKLITDESVDLTYQSVRPLD